MNKGFTLIETLVALALLLLAILFSARVMCFALAQSRQSALRFRLMETGDYYKHYLSSRPFPAPELAEGEHRQVDRKIVVNWRVKTAAAGLKRITLQAAVGLGSVTIVFYKSNVIQEVKND